MALSLADHWIWDFWFAQDGDDVHVFYLQAPKALGDPELRHHNASIGHAVSRDLRQWRVLPDAVEPGPAGAFDDLATWTGSVMQSDGLWHLFYTGVSKADAGAVQRIGLATSADLTTWLKTDVVFGADPRWYETLHPGVREEAWRDPWVWRDEKTGQFRMAITARANDGALDGRGVIGHAVSDDLMHWQATAPLSAPGEFYHLEVPQLVHIGGAWRMFFCATVADHSAARTARPGVIAETGSHYLVADSPDGPFVLDRDDFMLADQNQSMYAGRILAHQGQHFLFAWQNLDSAGEFVGALSDPMAVTVGADGALRVDAPV